jgi:predicted metal-dependent peptidase
MTQQKSSYTPATSDALTALLNADAFHSAMLMDMELIETTQMRGEPMPTACTDGFKKVWVNPDFMASMTPSQGAFVIAHEIGHKLLLYPQRFLDMKRTQPFFAPQLFNVAQDFLINAQLNHAGYPVEDLSKQKGSLTVQEFVDGIRAQSVGSGADHKAGFMFDPSVREAVTTESLYNQLSRELPDPDPNGGQSGAVSGVGGGEGNDVLMDAFQDTCDEQGLTPAQAGQQAENEIVSAAQNAMARDPGSVPGHIKAMVEAYAKPVVNWKAQLRRFISGRANDDWSFRRPNRRSAGTEIIQPSLFSSRPDQIVVIVDTSGSVSDRELAQGLAEVVTVSKRVKPKRITVISCDTQVNAVDEYRLGQSITTLTTNGRGGTNMDPAFQHVLDQGWRPECIICFTDGELIHPDRSMVRTSVLWAICNPTNERAFEVPYGKVIRVTADG